MKTRLLAFVLIFCASFTTNAQYVTIPDQNFVDWLITYGYGNCMSGNQMDTTCNEVIYETGINLATVGVNDVYGIQFFDDLTYLNCNYNNLTYLPELPRKLQILSCTDNQITSLPPLPDSVVSLYASRNQLISLPQLNSVISQIVVDYNLIQS